MINYDKSEVVLSSNVSEGLVNSFKQWLSVTIVPHHRKYVGLPLVLNRKVSSNFSAILDRNWAKANGWSASNLSVGGKEVLIKSLLQALPQYYMHCFLIPTNVIDKIEKTIRRFWWSNKQCHTPVHWVKKSLMLKETEQGGLGFKDLKLLNKAFLGKQVWRIIHRPELLVSKLLKARYFHDCHVLDASIGSRPSYCWRSLTKSFDLVKAGSDIDRQSTMT
ncbi:hypothetical protein QQ045_019985 [Rhodiola kirilowii]